MVTLKMLNLFVGVHQKVRRQLLYLLYSDNIFVFYIHIFHAVFKKSSTLVHKNKRRQLSNKFMAQFGKSFFDNKIFKKFHFEKIILKNPIWKKIKIQIKRNGFKKYIYSLIQKKTLPQNLFFLGKSIWGKSHWGKRKSNLKNGFKYIYIFTA